jgi:hypothetical protein
MSSQPNFMSQEFVGMGTKRIKELTELQTELFEKLQEVNRRWVDRMEAEAGLASDFGTKLTGAHSVPETVTACQEWASKRIEMATEDAKHLMSDTRTFMDAGARLLSSGWPSAGSRGST